MEDECENLRIRCIHTVLKVQCLQLRGYVYPLVTAALNMLNSPASQAVTITKQVTAKLFSSPYCSVAKSAFCKDVGCNKHKVSEWVFSSSRSLVRPTASNQLTASRKFWANKKKKYSCTNGKVLSEKENKSRNPGCIYRIKSSENTV